MKVVTAQQMQYIDRVTIEHYGIAGEVLMAMAGKSVADYVLKNINPTSIAVFCGVGNNGGDGYYAAYLLSQHIRVEAFIAGALEKMTPSSKLYYDVCCNAQVPMTVLSYELLESLDVHTFDIIIDALVGTGFSGQPRGLLQQVINLINDSGIEVIAIDIPSGLPANGSIESNTIVKAHTTITMGLPKINLVTYPGKFFAGNVIVADIGFPHVLCQAKDITRQLIDNEFIVSNYRPQKNYDAHKGTNGHLLCIGGFDGMEGAIMLCADAAFKLGIGLVTIATTPSARAVIAGKIKEAITTTINIELDATAFLPQVFDTSTFTSQVEMVTKQLESIIQQVRPTACVVGPGLGRSVTAALVFAAYCGCSSTLDLPTVIDGDGLYFVALLQGKIKLPRVCILTPHFKEAARIVGNKVYDIKKNRLYEAEALASKCGCITVLKGPSSIVTDGTNTAINTTGNPALATGGSGDVLTGIIGSLLAKGISPFVAASVGVYLHGSAADIYCKKSGVQVMCAGDIIQHIRDSLFELDGMY